MNTENVVDDFADLPEYFRPVAKEFGRDLFALTMNVGMAAQAAEHASRSPAALELLCTSYNELSSSYIKKMGWTEVQLLACDQAIQLAFASQLQVPSSSLVLPPNLH